VTSEGPQHDVSFREAARFWAKLGFINFGGPAGQIALMHEEIVDRRAWVSNGRFLHALNFCMLLPGPEAQQLAIYIGWTKHGIRGGLAAGTLFVLPGLLVIVALSIVAVHYGRVPLVQGALFGLQAATLAIVAQALIRVAGRSLEGGAAYFIAGAAFLALYAFRVPFPAVVLLAGLFGALVFRAAAPGAETVQSAPRRSSALRVVAACLVLWLVPIALLAYLLGREHVLTAEALFFSKMAMVTFGGAYAVLSYVAQQAVEAYGWLTSAQMLQGLALAETTPGPLILVLTYVGFLAAHASPAPFTPLVAGLLGALVTTWVTFVPCFLWVLAGAPYIDRIRRAGALAGALRGIAAAVVGVILNLSLWFAVHVLFGTVERVGFGPMQLDVPVLASVDWPALALAAASLLALVALRTPMLVVLGAALLAGIALRA
jgi:chromate transporter